MYDSVSLWLPNDLAGDLKHLPARIQQPSFISKEDGSLTLIGGLGGLKITARESGVSVKGSLNKYLLKSNIQSIGRQDAKEAILMLSDSLSLPFEKAKVTRVDVAANILVKYPPKLYYQFLGVSSRYERLEQPQSIYYNNGKRVKLFYNKLAEIKKYRIPVPDILQGKNVLRFEFRLMRNVAEQMKVNEVTGSTLTNERFYMDMLDRWHKEYLNIQKQVKTKIDFMQKQINTPKEFFNQMAWAMISDLGEKQALQLVDDLKLAGKFEFKEYPSRLKREIREGLRRASKNSPKSELIEELDVKIKRATNYYR